MIRYALLCAADHAFEAWFPDSDAFDAQNGSGQVACPACGGVDVRKAVMAPAVRRSAGKRPPHPDAAPETPRPSTIAEPTPAATPAIVDDGFVRMRAALRELHAKLKRDAANVGPAFSEQARAIHEGDAPPRAIYGTATGDEVRELVADGIGIMPVPPLPEDCN